VKGLEAGTGNPLQSARFPAVFSSGGTVCPAGYVLQLDQGISDAGSGLRGVGACRFCTSGTYSLNAIAPRDEALSAAPGCLNCPAGAACDRGGADVRFLAGAWIAVGGRYRLLSCPPGHQLINSTAGTSSGAFAHDLQQCRACPVEEYIVDPSADACTACPKGALCPADRACALRSPPAFACAGGGRIVGDWRLDNATRHYAVVDCPPGYSMIGAGKAESESLQQCKPCLPNQYILNPATDDCQACPPGLTCRGDAEVQLRTSGAVWRRAGGIYRLDSCPTGYGVVSAGPAGGFSAEAQDCQPCKEGTECTLPAPPARRGRTRAPRAWARASCARRARTAPSSGPGRRGTAPRAPTRPPRAGWRGRPPGGPATAPRATTPQSTRVRSRSRAPPARGARSAPAECAPSRTLSSAAWAESGLWETGAWTPRPGSTPCGAARTATARSLRRRRQRSFRSAARASAAWNTSCDPTWTPVRSAPPG
jgi:hypothetical protein